MKFLLVTNMYPKVGDLYRNAFIHSRVIQYKKLNIEVEIFVLNPNDTLNIYEYEGIKVTEGSKTKLRIFLNEMSFSKILIHFISKEMIDVLEDIRIKTPIVIWIHGTEALGWYRRLWLINYYKFNFIKYIKHNTRQMIALRRLIQNKNSLNIKFVFVSNWMKNITEKDTLSKIKNYEVIPNLINTELFKYQTKSPELRKNILLVRSFETKKYANDISINAIIELSKKPYFSDLKISIFGDGRDFKKLTEPLRKFPNVKITQRFLRQKEIAQKHRENGIFLCPTRQDSQGVSMCEAMASGLVPITSLNTAIPEFVENEVSGFLTKNYIEIVEKVEELYKNEKLFEFMSYKASNSIYDICNEKSILTKEVKILRE